MLYATIEVCEGNRMNHSTSAAIRCEKKFFFSTCNLDDSVYNRIQKGKICLANG